MSVFSVTTFATGIEGADIEYLTITNHGEYSEVRWYDVIEQEWQTESGRRIDINVSVRRTTQIRLQINTNHLDIATVNYRNRRHTVAPGETITIHRPDVAGAANSQSNNQAGQVTAPVASPRTGNNPATGNPWSWGIANSQPGSLQELRTAFPDYHGQVFYRGHVPFGPGHFTPYMGVDFTEAAINERIQAMRALYPHGRAWSPSTVNANCGVFAVMMQEAAFGWWTQLPMTPVRIHTNWDEIRVGDRVIVRNSTGGLHEVFIIAISADGNTFTLAEGNIGGRVGWDRTITMAQLRAGGTRHNAGVRVHSRFNEDGTIVARPDAIQDPSRRPDASALPPVTQPVPPAIATPPTTTPAQTAPSTATPAPAVPAQTAPVNLGVIIIMNMSDSDGRVIQTNFGSGWHESRSSINSFSTSTINGLRTTAEIGSSDFTIEFNGVTHVVRPGETLELGGAPVQTQTPAQVGTGTLTIENRSSDTQRIITFTNNVTGQSRTSRNRIDRDSSIIVYLRTDATAEATAGSASITVTFGGQTYTVAPGQTVTTTN